MSAGEAATKVLEALLLMASSGGLVGWYVSLRKDRRETRKDDRDASKDRVDLVASLWGTIDEINGRALKATTDAAQAREDAAGAQEKAARAEHESLWLRGIVSSFIRPVVAWIDAGAQPPPPEITAEVRTVLAAVEDHQPTV